ncbi:MAG: hypothetical protein WCI60_03745 [bacterium]
MITNTGKNILAKYLVGQAPAYASYIAVGCGPKPLPADYDFNASINADEVFAMKSKTHLDFEMFRVPITSRGYVSDNGINKIVLTAELPTEERYEFSEVGLYSAGSNPSAGAYDSKMVYSFNDTENWEYHSSTQSVAIPTIYTALDDRVLKISSASISGTTVTYTTDAAHGYTVGQTVSIFEVLPVQFNLTNLVIATVPTSNTLTVTAPTTFTKIYTSGGYIINDVDTGIITQTYPIFQTNADNKTFNNSHRVARSERCRILNNIIMVRGDSANLNSSLVPQTGSTHIHLTGAALDFTKNAPTDLLKLAFSIVNKDPLSEIQPDSVRVLVEFTSTDVYDNGQWARFEYTANKEDYDFATNRYMIATKQLQDLHKSTGFTWNAVDTVKIYASVMTKSGDVYTPSSNYYVALDALRLDNLSTANPLYGLTGYSVIANTNSETIIKIANTTNYIEFRFGMDVV